VGPPAPGHGPSPGRRDASLVMLRIAPRRAAIIPGSTSCIKRYAANTSTSKCRRYPFSGKSRKPGGPARSAAAADGGGAPAVWVPVAAFLRSYQLDGGYTPGPLLAVCALAGLAGCAPLLRRRPDPRVRQLALACLLFFTSAAAVTLVSDAFEFSWRYQLPALVTLAPAGALGISVIIRLAGNRRGVQSGHAG